MNPLRRFRWKARRALGIRVRGVRWADNWMNHWRGRQRSAIAGQR